MAASTGRSSCRGPAEVVVAQQLLLADHLRALGADRYLHRPFAWFGDHTGFYGYDRYDDFHPSDRRLGANDVAILDVSPIVDGYVGDVGHSLAFGQNAQFDAAQDFLRGLRAELPSLFASSRTPAEIWAHVNRRVADAGFDAAHTKYPHCVLGHRVFRVRQRKGAPVRLGWGGLGWFSLESNWELYRRGPSAALGPEHVGRKFGLWAIEPHVGWKTGGCKFEEILVVDSDGARWLDEDVPLVRIAIGGKTR